jgi:hypothetical protein
VERVSVSSSGAQADDISASPSISADGRFVAFCSLADNLVPGDTNGDWDVFVRDRARGTTERVSVASDGREANGTCLWPAISPDGRFVAFTSWADNLVPGDTDRREEILVRDRLRRTTVRLGAAAWAPSALGPRDRDVSADGRWIAFQSDSPGLAPGDTNGVQDVLVMRASGGAPPPWECQPTIDVLWPPWGAAITVRGVANLCADASGPCGVYVNFEAGPMHEWGCQNEILLAKVTSPPYCYAWDTRQAWVAEGRWCLDFSACAEGGCLVAAMRGITIDNTTFDDVAKSDICWRFVEALADAAATSGCKASPPLYCPSWPVTRGQAAKLLCRAAGKTWLARPAPTFADVPRSHPFYGRIERLADADSWGGNPPTSGCKTVGGTRYFCPSAPLTRGQAAKLLCAAAGKPRLNSPTPTFADVPATHPFYGWIERLTDAASWGGTAPASGCGSGVFCPDATVARAEMAKLLVLALGLPYYGG